MIVLNFVQTCSNRALLLFFEMQPVSLCAEGKTNINKLTSLSACYHCATGEVSGLGRMQSGSDTRSASPEMGMQRLCGNVAVHFKSLS